MQRPPPPLKETLVQVTLLKLFIFFLVFFSHFLFVGCFDFLNFWVSCFFKLYGGAGGGTALCQPPAPGGSQQDIGAFPAQRTAGELTGLLEFGEPGPLPAQFATGRAG